MLQADGYAKPFICPYLGLKGFPNIAVGYPSFRNACHRAGHPDAVTPDQQLAVCLGGYLGCPAFQQDGENE